MSSSNARPLDALMAVVARHWGYHELRPLQEQAMQATLDGRDSLVILAAESGSLAGPSLWRF